VFVRESVRVKLATVSTALQTGKPSKVCLCVSKYMFVRVREHTCLCESMCVCVCVRVSEGRI